MRERRRAQKQVSERPYKSCLPPTGTSLGYASGVCPRCLNAGWRDLTKWAEENFPQFEPNFIKIQKLEYQSFNPILLTITFNDLAWSIIVLKVSVRRKLKRLISDETGVVALDYGMIASILAVAVITGLSPVGTNLGSSFKAAADALVAAPALTPIPAAPPPGGMVPKVRP